MRSEERTLSIAHNKTTFTLTNVIPQTPDLNRKIWLNLEQFCEKLCKIENKELYIIAGGIYKSKKQIESKVTIPDTCFKIIVILNKGQGLNNVDTNTKVIAVKMPNTQGINGSYAQYLCTVDDIEASTGYDYLSLVRVEIQRVVERRVYNGYAKY